MAELPAITTAPAPNRDFIQIYTKLGTKAISLGFWEANLRSQRQHDIDSSTIDTLTTTTPRSQITDVEFYGAPAVLGFLSQPNGKHAVAFLSPAFKLLLPPGNLKTTTANTFPGLAGLTMPTAQNDTLGYLYYMRYGVFYPSRPYLHM